MALLSLLPILGYALFIHVRFKKVASVSLFFSITFIISTLFLFGLVSLLHFGANLLFYLGILILIYTFYRYRKECKDTIVQPPLIIFLAFSIIAFYAFKDANLIFWDEYSHWGIYIKEMFYFHHFYDASSIADHLNYPPGISIWDYFVLLNSDYHEGALYFAYFLILFSSTLMMYEKISWNQWYWLLLVFAIQMLLFATFGHWFSSIYVDHVIGALFAGLILSYLADRYQPIEMLLFIFPLISIVLIKEIGLYFGFAAVGLYGLIIIMKRVDTKKSFFASIKLEKRPLLILVLFLLSILFVHKAWLLHQRENGIAVEKQSISGIVKSAISNKNVLSEEIEEKVKANFVNVVLHQQLHKEKLSLNYNEFSTSIMQKYQKSIKLTTIGFLIYFFAMILMALKLTKPAVKRREILLIGRYLFLIFIIYLAILYMSYLVAFGNDAVRIPSYVRYINMATLPLLFIAFSFFLPFYQCLDNTKAKIGKNNITSPHLVGSAITLVLLGLITQPYIKPLYKQLESPFRSQIEPISKQIIVNVPLQSRLFVVFPVKNRGSLNNTLQYTLIPTQSTISQSGFSELSSEQMRSIFRKYDYIWFASFNKSIINKNSDLLMDQSQSRPYILYKVEKENQQLALKPIL